VSPKGKEKELLKNMLSYAQGILNHALEDKPGLIQLGQLFACCIAALMVLLSPVDFPRVKPVPSPVRILACSCVLGFFSVFNAPLTV
jgi:hypothetical protein